MTYKTLKLDWEANLALITLNRPEKRNAISSAMIEELMGALEESEQRPVRVVILTGEGKAFCAGMDLETLQAMTAQSAAEVLADAKRIAQLFLRIWSFPKPTIAAVNGHALAGGCGIATQCDFTLAERDATFGYPEVKIGFLPALVSVFLRRQIGDKQARDLLLTGKIIDAAEAYRLGLVTEMVSTGDLLARARAIAATLAAASPTSIASTKKLLHDFAAADIERELAMAIAANAQIRETEDFHEGLSSFLEKRAPQWTRK